MIQRRTSRVHGLSEGVVGYLHVPDMESTGYSEFWRHYACEVRKGSLILDLRGNTGGHISELLLSKLSQRALAWDIPRRGERRLPVEYASARSSCSWMTAPGPMRNSWRNLSESFVEDELSVLARGAVCSPSTKRLTSSTDPN